MRILSPHGGNDTFATLGCSSMEEEATVKVQTYTFVLVHISSWGVMC